MRAVADGVTVSALTLGQAGFEERVTAAALAGFSSIGMSVELYESELASGADDGRLAELMTVHGIRLSEVEFLSGWGPASRSDAAASAKEQTAFHIARTFGAEQINAGLFQAFSPEAMSESFAGLCERAGDLKLALEFMPFGGIPDLRTAWEIVRRSGATNGGLLVDVWHWVRAGMGPPDLEGVPAGKVYAIQVCDVGPHPLTDQRYESLHHRMIPGRGAGKVVEVLRLFADYGLTAPLSAEVMSDALLENGAESAAKEVFTGLASVVRSSGYPLTRRAVG